MKILVTGGAGFIGSNFIRLILAKYPDYEIVNLDKLTYCGNIDNLNDVEKNPNYKTVNCKHHFVITGFRFLKIWRRI